MKLKMWVGSASLEGALLLNPQPINAVIIIEKALAAYVGIICLNSLATFFRTKIPLTIFLSELPK